MALSKAGAVLAIILFASTAIFAALFAWQYMEDEHKSNEPSGTKPSPTVEPETGGCPFYPQPQKIAFEKSPEFTKLFEWMTTYLISTLDTETRPSISANLVYLDEVVWKGNFGNISKSIHESPTENTIYRIASISKVFPVLYLFKLWEDGKVDLHDAVTKYAPDFTVQPQLGSTDNINLIDLASQISGLPGSLPFNPLTESAIIFNGELEDALELMTTQVLAAEPRTKCIYSLSATRRYFGQKFQWKKFHRMGAGEHRGQAAIA